VTEITRPSMWSLVQRANWLIEAQCPTCPARNESGKKPYIEILPNHLARCKRCESEWEPILTRPVPV